MKQLSEQQSLFCVQLWPFAARHCSPPLPQKRGSSPGR
jgi:hypothetical protein